MNVLGVVMAGGRNIRYGGLKALAEVGNRRIVDRVSDALRAVTPHVVLITNDAPAYASLGLPMRADEQKSGAALAGLLTALHWAAQRAQDGVLTVACDMPFVTGELLRSIVAMAAQGGADIVVPESGGPRGIEPLCAFYSIRCSPAIETAMARDDLRMIGFHDNVNVARLSLDDVRAIGDPNVLFLNVNTPEELAAAQAIAETGRV